MTEYWNTVMMWFGRQTKGYRQAPMPSVSKMMKPQATSTRMASCHCTRVSGSRSMRAAMWPRIASGRADTGNPLLARSGSAIRFPLSALSPDCLFGRAHLIVRHRLRLAAQARAPDADRVYPGHVWFCTVEERRATTAN